MTLNQQTDARYTIWPMTPKAVRKARHSGFKWEWNCICDGQVIEEGRTWWLWGAHVAGKRAVRRHLRAARRYNRYAKKHS